MKPYYKHNGITIYHGDSREVIPALTQRFGMCVTDPPYGTENLAGGYGRRQLHFADGKSGAKISNDSDLSQIEATAPLIYAAMEDKSWLFTFCAARRMIEAATVFHNEGFEFFGEIIWDKCSPGLGYTIRYAHESALVFRKGDAEKSGDSIMSIQREAVDRVDMQGRHPHEKPVSVLKGIMLLGAGTILDPFMGGGTSMRAAKDLGREAVGIEIDERFCEMAVKRLAQEVMAFA